MEEVTAIITCKGRLAHLRQTLPILVRESSWRVVLVDYSCPDGSGVWAEQSFGDRVLVVRVPGRAHFNKAAAITEGLHMVEKILPQSWVALVDADTFVRGQASRTIETLLCRHHPWMIFASCRPEQRDLFGFTVLPPGAFRAVGGPDPSFLGWGSEDIEYRMRVHYLGKFGFQVIDPSILGSIPHDDTDRTRFYAEKNIQTSQAWNLSIVRENYRLWTGREFNDDALVDVALRKLIGTYWMAGKGAENCPPPAVPVG
jgi:hypothetical protein